MAFWPFRRKSRRKRASGTNVGSLRGRATDPLPPGRSQTEPQTIPHGDSPTLGRQGNEPNKLQRRARAYSFSPGRDESLQVTRTRPGKGRSRAAPPLSSIRGSRKHKAMDKEQGGMYDEDGDELFRVPTLHNKRDGDHLPRKKSSKKRRKDDDREAEIKAMSNFMPVRPAAEDWAGRPLRKETKRARAGGFGLRMGGTGEWDKEHRSSDISLPTQESIHSAMSSESEHLSFRVGVFEALAPRPTLRYASHPRAWTMSGGGGGGGLSERPFDRRRFSEKEPIPEATIRAHKRVDDLANDLSASDLRELMERDQRRRERKRLKEQERVERRLMRQAERHGVAEAHAIAQGRESPPNLERGVLGRESIGLGIDPASAVVTSSRRRESDESPRSRKSEEDDLIADEKIPHPLETFHRTDSIPLDSPIGDPEKSAPFSASPDAGLKRLRSRSPQESEVTTETYSTPRKVSDGSVSKSWTSFFKWGKNKRVLSAGPSSFSNTSRDSMQNAHVPAPPVSAVPRRVSSGMPKRTMSRFREDLPEFPLSPPDSRIQSPEVEMIPPTIEEASPDPQAHVEGFTFAPTTHSIRNDTPVSAMDMVRGTPSPSQLEDHGISPEPGAMSLASLDSEGSWLSGRMGKRASSALARTPTPLYNLRDDEQDARMENTSIAEEDDGSRSPPSRTPTGLDKTAASSDGEDDDDARWGSVRGAQQPVLIHGHSAERMKSREVLLNYDEDDEGNDELGMGEADDIGVQRATSVNLGQGHARRVSAGSARLLDVTPRHSIDKSRSRSPRI